MASPVPKARLRARIRAHNRPASGAPKAGRLYCHYMLRLTSRAVSCTFSPPRSRSRPAPSIVLHPAAMVLIAMTSANNKVLIFDPFVLAAYPGATRRAGALRADAVAGRRHISAFETTPGSSERLTAHIVPVETPGEPRLRRAVAFERSFRD